MITGYTGSNSVVSIPDQINFLPVTSIGWGTFYGINITNVTIPKSVKSIATAAFFGCTSLASITIPSSITNIGEAAFSSCWSLTNVAIPASVIGIGDYAFFDCTNLAAITVAAANPYYSSQEGVLFNKNKTILMQYPAGKAGSYAIPVTVTSLADEAFGYNDHDQFWPPYSSCIGLTNLIVPASLTRIGDHAFSHCSGLTTVTLSNGVASLGAEAFSWCSNLRRISVPGTVTNIGDLAFYYAGLENVTIPGSVSNIGFAAFGVCGSLAKVMIQNGVTSIGELGFNSCENLTNISLPDSLTMIGDRAFWFCASLTNVTIPRCVVSIGSYAFSVCPSLENINVDPGNALYSSVDGVLCNKDKTILIQFPGGRGGTYRVPSGITNIADFAFGDYIAPDAEYNYLPVCANLNSIIFPSSVVVIGTEDWLFLENLTSVYFEGDALADFGDLFGDWNLTVYYLPSTVGWDGLGCVPWLPQIQMAGASLGAQKKKFGFNIHWASGQIVLVEASTNLVDWQPIKTNALPAGSATFSDPQQANYPNRFYRLSSPQ